MLRPRAQLRQRAQLFGHKFFERVGGHDANINRGERLDKTARPSPNLAQRLRDVAE
ncbi:MAG TPA: hypothetical protein VE344_11575 [Methylomirabilota bacterium]|nr:hypothetical protein [Methylomirabilota bacterium]